MDQAITFHYPTTRMFQADGDVYKFGREPSLRRMPDGSLISLVYSGGEREPSDENFVALIQSYDDGETWSSPRIIFNSDTHAVWGTEIFTEGETPFAIIHTFHKSTHYQEINAYRSFSKDSGKTWSAPESIPGVPQSMSVRQGKVLSNGDWIFPIYWGENYPETPETAKSHHFNNRTQFVCGAIRSTNQGKCFSCHGYIKAPNDKSLWEPEITELDDGHLLMLIRYDRTLMASESLDYGCTWSQPTPVPIPNPGAKITLYKIAEKHILFSNICKEGEAPHRHRLEAWISDDNCKTWNKKVTLAEVKNPDEPVINVTYPHGFSDEEKGIFYLAIDSNRFFSMMKIPLEKLMINEK